MHYDPVKNVFASVIRKIPFFRILFYKFLDLMFLRSWYVRRELKIIRKTFGSQKIKILDAGTGYGQYAYFMANKLSPCEIKAVDVKDDWIKDCKTFFEQQKISNVTFEIEDLTKINYQNEFDLIVCVDVMEHIPDDVKVFQNFYNALKSNGFLIINTPSIFGGSDVHDEEDESFIGEHTRVGYSKEELEEKLHPIGFITYQSKYTYGFWGDKAWRLGIKYPIILLNISKLFFIILPFYYLITFPFTLIMMYLDYKSDNIVGSGINFIAKKV
ncbi:class I SAM-dependent methyltransferase [Ignavibacterium sp.]|uniref:class I SAM-dependent methyltransferase n=1 Tax=Ignavibacterium sp. TaxID=2651167 RepID=UPI00307E16F4